MGFSIECKFYDQIKDVARYGDFSNKSIKQILQIRRHNASKTFVFHIATARAMRYVSTALCITLLLDLWDANLKTQSERGG